jgi:hypothetical protein
MEFSQGLGECRRILSVDPVREIVDSAMLKARASIEAPSFDLI